MGVDETVNDVLVLEDDAVFSICLSKLLRELGYNPTVVGSVEEARAAVEEGDFYAAILDKRVPEQIGGHEMKDAGINFSYELKESKPHIRVALHSAEIGFMDAEVREYIESRGICLIEKPAEEKPLKDFLEK